MRLIIRRFDGFLSRCTGVFEVTGDPACLLRLQAGRTGRKLSLPCGTFPPDMPAVILHLWNERMAPLPAAGADLVYARNLLRGMIYSYRMVASYIKTAPEFQDAELVGGVTVLAPLEAPDGGTSMLRQMGFTVLPYHSPLGRFGEFWENFYTWWLMWAYNPASLRWQTLLGLRRSEFWMPKSEFMQRYGDR